MEFKHEISFISKTLKGEPPEWKDEIITKEVTFKELSRTDKSQRDLCWLIMEIFKSEKKKTRIDREIASKFADLYVQEMLIIDEKFTEQNKEELMTDNGAMVTLGLWLVHEKVVPFFFVLMGTSNEPVKT